MHTLALVAIIAAAVAILVGYGWTIKNGPRWAEEAEAKRAAREAAQDGEVAA